MSGRTQIAVGAAAVVCLALSTVLVLLAVDVSRWGTALDSGDARYRWAPRAATLWQADDLVPGGAGARLLGIEDDRAFREAIRSLRTARLQDPIVSDPTVAIRRNEAQARLEAIVAGDRDSSRRSRAAGLLGVLGLARFVYEAEGREVLLSATVASLRLALELDPDNDEAKTNLEVAYQRGRALALSEGSAGQNPSPGGSGSKGAGAGDAGSGY
jgi:hypothetical protein